MPAQQPTPDQQLRIATIVWLALLGSVIVYTLVGLYAAPAPAVTPDLGMMRWVMIAAGIGSTGGIFVMRQVLGARERTLASWFTTSIVSWALAESVAIYGLVLRFMGDEPKMLYGFVAWSAVLMLRFRPTRAELDTWLSP
jgi:F0F1-type ATP synthase membrane subunit c/vacuolar-type H+-ATPase subunit K